MDGPSEVATATSDLPVYKLYPEFKVPEPIDPTESDLALVENARELTEFFRFSGYFLGTKKRGMRDIIRYSDRYYQVEGLRPLEEEMRFASTLFPHELERAKRRARESELEADIARGAAQYVSASDMLHRVQRLLRGNDTDQQLADALAEAEAEDNEDKEDDGLELTEEERLLQDLEEAEAAGDYGEVHHDDDEEGADAYGEDEGPML